MSDKDCSYHAVVEDSPKNCKTSLFFHGVFACLGLGIVIYISPWPRLSLVTSTESLNVKAAAWGTRPLNAVPTCWSQLKHCQFECMHHAYLPTRLCQKSCKAWTVSKCKPAMKCPSATQHSTCCPQEVLRVGSYNVLCDTYAVKWGNREGIGPDGASNWGTRWPVMRDIVLRAKLDVLCLQEVEPDDVEEIVQSLGKEYQAHYFKHIKRPPDGVMIIVRSEAFEAAMLPRELQWNGAVAFGSVDLVLRSNGKRVRIVNAHLRGGKTEQIADLAAFANANSVADVTVVAGDFNEDFGLRRGTFQVPLPDGPQGSWATLQREAGLPNVSRPPHKQVQEEDREKGQVDFIFVQGDAELFRDAASRTAIIESHTTCEATGQWPSDHGCEAFSIRIASPSRH